MWVVKLGGSLWDSPCLPAWLDRLAAGPQAVVVVPGGGPFADQVRTVQARWGFDDAAAHAMALHAMEQMARMVCALRPGCATADSPAQIRAIQERGDLPVWLPVAMTLRDRTITADWSLTSDSLALWLARGLTASGVVLVKSAQLPESPVDISQLHQSGLVDPCFERFRRALDCPVWLVHRKHIDAWTGITEGLAASALAC